MNAELDDHVARYRASIDFDVSRRVEVEVMERACALARRYASHAERARLETLDRALAVPLDLTPAELIRARHERDRIVRSACRASRTVQEQLREIAPPSYDLALFGPHQTLIEDHLDELRRSTIDARLARDAGLWSESWSPLISNILNMFAHRDGDYIVFPYRRPGCAEPVTLRVKRTTGKAIYLGRGGERTPIYYPPGVLARGDLQDRDKPLIITEGEKKGLALDRMEYAVIALPGVYNHHDAALKRRTGAQRLHPWILEDVLVRGRDVVIAFDPNVECPVPLISPACVPTNFPGREGETARASVSHLALADR